LRASFCRFSLATRLRFLIALLYCLPIVRQ
jgi:hypothetical protein